MLQNVDGLQNISSIGGSIQFVANPTLDFSNFTTGLTTINGDLNLKGNIINLEL